MFVDIIIIICFVLFVILCIVGGVLKRRFSNKVWSVTVDGKEYGPVTALDFEERRNEVSFVHLAENRVYRLVYVELKYVELIPCEEKNGDVDVFEADPKEQVHEDR